jgi:hypothetical protein
MERPWRVPIAWDVSRLMARIHIFPQLKLVLLSINKVALFLYLFNEKVLREERACESASLSVTNATCWKRSDSRPANVLVARTRELYGGNMLNGWEILLLGAVILIFVVVPLAISALVLCLVLRKKPSRVPPVIRG